MARGYVLSVQTLENFLTNSFQLEFSWSERQYILPRHVRNMIGIGALIWILERFLAFQSWVVSQVFKYLLERRVAIF